MRIGGIQKTSLTDYPGQIAAIVFTQGCNLKCPYCYNPALNAADQEKDLINTEEILEFFKKRKGKLDAAVVTGGEPTLQSSLRDFLRQLKDMGYLVKLDTNGTRPDIVIDLCEKELVDYVAMDVKAPPEKYERLAGVQVDIERLRQGISYVINSGFSHEFRTTMTPSLLDKQDIPRIGELIKGGDKWYLQKLLSFEVDLIDSNLKNTSAFTDREMEEMRAAGSEYVKECGWR